MIAHGEGLVSLIGQERVNVTIGGECYSLSVESSPNCTGNCPAGVNVKGYVNLTANRYFHRALELIRESNPFPAICGRVCTHPCEPNCALSAFGEPVSIRAIKRYVADYEVSRRPIVNAPHPVRYEERIAVVGSGPAGLTVASDLTRLGYTVTVFEAMDVPGGMLAWGIPEFRLPARVLRREIRVIQSTGVKIVTGRRVEDPRSLFGEGFSAIIIAAGAWKGTPLGIEGERESGVVDGLDFLRKACRGEISVLKGKALIIGGGNAAFDVARTASRMGADVTIVYRRSEVEMPANRDEIIEAKEEGVTILELSLPKRITAKKGLVTGVEIQRTRLGERDDSGRRSPVPIEGSEYLLDCDWVIPSIGSSPDLPTDGDIGITLTEGGLIKTDSLFQTATERVFAVGDVVSGPSTVVEVIGKAHVCASSAHSVLRGMDSVLSLVPSRGKGVVISAPPTAVDPRFPVDRLSPDERKASLVKEVEKTLTGPVAVRESSRCDRCGPCSECEVCLPICGSKQALAAIDGKSFILKLPEKLSRALYQGGENTVSYRAGGAEKRMRMSSLTPRVDASKCIACGRCEGMCAYQAIRMSIGSDGTVVSLIDHDVCRGCGRCVLSCPAEAIDFEMYHTTRLQTEMDNSIRENDGVVVFSDYWQTSNTRHSVDCVVALMSVDAITVPLIIRALASGARGVLVMDSGKSHYLDIHIRTRDSVHSCKNLLDLAGIDSRRVVLSDSEDLKGALDRFKKDLARYDLNVYSPVAADDPGNRVHRSIFHLVELVAREGKREHSSFLAHMALLDSNGMPYINRIVDSVDFLIWRAGVQTTTKGLDLRQVEPWNRESPPPTILSEELEEFISRLDLKPEKVRIGLQPSAYQTDDLYYQSFKRVLTCIKPVELVELSPPKKLTNLDRGIGTNRREEAMDILRAWQKEGVLLVIPTSIDLALFFNEVNGSESWRYLPIKIMDIFSFLAETIKETEKNERG